MRFLSILTALLLVPALAARRGATPAAAPATRKHILVPQWGFPYGWGLGPGVEAEGIETPAEDQKTVKQVKRVLKKGEVPPKTGWFARSHERVDEVEVLMDGLE